MSHAIWKATIKRLERRKRSLVLEVARLQAKQEARLFEANSLSVWCEAVAILRSLGIQDVPGASPLHVQQLSTLHEQEQEQLHQNQQLLGNSAGHSWVAAALDCVGPSSAPLAHMRQQLEQPVLGCAVNNMTATDLAVLYKTVLLDLSLQLNLLSQGAALSEMQQQQLNQQAHNKNSKQQQLLLQQQQQQQAQQQAAQQEKEQQSLQRMKDSWGRYMQTLVSLVAADRHDVLESHYLYDVDTLQPAAHATTPACDAPAVAPDLAAAILEQLPLLQLTDQQQFSITTSLSLLYRQLEPLAAERKALQVQLSSAPVSPLLEMTSTPALLLGSSAGGSLDSSCYLAAAGNNTPSSFPATGSIGGIGSINGPDCLAASAHAAAAAAAAAAACGGGSSSSWRTSSCSTSSSTSSHSDSYCFPLLDRAEQLEQQQEQLRRLQSLMRKESILRLIGMVWFLGLLSYKQLVQAAIMCWPYPVQFEAVAEAVRQHAARQQPTQKGARQAAAAAAATAVAVGGPERSPGAVSGAAAAAAATSGGTAAAAAVDSAVVAVDGAACAAVTAHDSMGAGTANAATLNFEACGAGAGADGGGGAAVAGFCADGSAGGCYYMPAVTYFYPTMQQQQEAEVPPHFAYHQVKAEEHLHALDLVDEQDLQDDDMLMFWSEGRMSLST